MSEFPTLRRGTRGEYVEYLQELLNFHGDSLTVDGIFGEKTEHAVQVFQSNRGLWVDGAVGTNTWGELTGQAVDHAGSGGWAAEHGAGEHGGEETPTFHLVDFHLDPYFDGRTLRFTVVNRGNGTAHTSDGIIDLILMWPEGNRDLHRGARLELPHDLPPGATYERAFEIPEHFLEGRYVLVITLDINTDYHQGRPEEFSASRVTRQREYEVSIEEGRTPELGSWV